MYVDLHTLFFDTAQNFDLTPLLNNLEVKHTH